MVQQQRCNTRLTQFWHAKDSFRQVWAVLGGLGRAAAKPHLGRFRRVRDSRESARNCLKSA
eukprot:6676293-Alexandrium_andersonii.AAC.1